MHKHKCTDNQYGYDNNYYKDYNGYDYPKDPKKNSHVDIQKIKCVNSNINVNGIDITQIPQDANALNSRNKQTKIEQQIHKMVTDLEIK